MDSLIDDQHRQAAHHYRNLTSTYEMNRDLIAVGAYRQGADPVLDEAVAMRNKLEDYVRQNRTERVTFTEARAQLFGLFGLTEAKAAA
jgi:flagellum-specific ATP synthase